MRIVHLIDAASPQATPTSLALLAASLGRLGEVEQHVVLLGGQSLTRAAASAGLDLADPHVHRLGVPFGRGVLGLPAAARLLGALGRFDVAHCWSLGAMNLATLVLRGVPRLLSVTGSLTVRQVHWLRAVCGEVGSGEEVGPGPVLAPMSATIRRQLLSGGIDERRVHVLRPAIDLARVESAGRGALREQWLGEPTGGPQPLVVALLGDPPGCGDARGGALLAGIVEEMLGRNVHLLVHPDQYRRRSALAMLRRTRSADRLIRDHRLATPWCVLPGCDLALAVGDAGEGLSLLWAMAANIPIVGEATYAISEIVEDRHSALLAKPGEQRELVRRIVQIARDDQLAWKLRDTARHEAYSFFSRQRYCRDLQQVYEQLAQGRPVQVPELESTGGLRFAGRG